ncbi:serine/threonine-protein kinase M1 [Nowakowskiella sp. JEL0407]|nr:serine/threonine-protein kinase M1 [Nowakowskiella sp. JEL0407]
MVEDDDNFAVADDILCGVDLDAMEQDSILSSQLSNAKRQSSNKTLPTPSTAQNPIKYSGFQEIEANFKPRIPYSQSAAPIGMSQASNFPKFPMNLRSNTTTQVKPQYAFFEEPKQENDHDEVQPPRRLSMSAKDSPTYEWTQKLLKMLQDETLLSDPMKDDTIKSFRSTIKSLLLHSLPINGRIVRKIAYNTYNLLLLTHQRIRDVFVKIDEGQEEESFLIWFLCHILQIFGTDCDVEVHNYLRDLTKIVIISGMEDFRSASTLLVFIKDVSLLLQRILDPMSSENLLFPMRIAKPQSLRFELNFYSLNIAARFCVDLLYTFAPVLVQLSVITSGLDDGILFWKKAHAVIQKSYYQYEYGTRKNLAINELKCSLLSIVNMYLDEHRTSIFPARWIPDLLSSYLALLKDQKNDSDFMKAFEESLCSYLNTCFNLYPLVNVDGDIKELKLQLMKSFEKSLWELYDVDNFFKIANPKMKIMLLKLVVGVEVRLPNTEALSEIIRRYQLITAGEATNTSNESADDVALIQKLIMSAVGNMGDNSSVMKRRASGTFTPNTPSKRARNVSVESEISSILAMETQANQQLAISSEPAEFNNPFDSLRTILDKACKENVDGWEESLNQLETMRHLAIRKTPFEKELRVNVTYNVVRLAEKICRNWYSLFDVAQSSARTKNVILSMIAVNSWNVLNSFDGNEKLTPHMAYLILLPWLGKINENLSNIPNSIDPNSANALRNYAAAEVRTSIMEAMKCPQGTAIINDDDEDQKYLFLCLKTAARIFPKKPSCWALWVLVLATWNDQRIEVRNLAWSHIGSIIQNIGNVRVAEYCGQHYVNSLCLEVDDNPKLVSAVLSYVAKCLNAAPRDSSIIMNSMNWARFLIPLKNDDNVLIRRSYLMIVRGIITHAESADLLSLLNMDSSNSFSLIKIFQSLESPNGLCRIAVGEITHSLLKRFVEAHETRPSRETLTNLRESHNYIGRILTDMVDTSNIALKEAALHIATELSPTATDELYPTILCVFLEGILSGSVMRRALAYQKLTDIATTKKITLQQIYPPYLDEISLFLVNRPNLFETFTSDSNSVKLFSRLLFRLTPIEFLQKTLSATLPIACANRNPDLLLRLSTMLSKPPAKLILENASYIFAHILLQSRDLNSPAFSFVLKQLDENLKNDPKQICSILASNLKMILTLTVLEMGKDDESRKRTAVETIDFVWNVLSDKNLNSTPVIVSGRDEFLGKHILGILAHINGYVAGTQNVRKPLLTDRIQIVLSLRELILLTGYYINVVSLQLIATLQTVLNTSDLQEPGFLALEAFVTTLQVSTIPPLLNQLVALLVKHYSTLPSHLRAKAIRLLKYMFINNMQPLSGALKDMFELPFLDEFAEINNIIRKYQGEQTLNERIMVVLRNVAHESPDVCYYALNELVNILKQSRQTIHEQTLRENPDACVESMYYTLLRMCGKYNGTRSDILLLCTKCLGILGATDPARIGLTDLNTEEILVLDSNSNESDILTFQCYLLANYLVPAFRSSTSTNSQSILAYSIQEVLRLAGFTFAISEKAKYGATRRDVDGDKYLIEKWNEFDQQTIEVMSPLLTTRYNIASTVTDTNTPPFFPSSENFRDWVQTWTLELIQNLPTTTPSMQALKTLFSVSVGVVKVADVNTALFLLPYISKISITNGSVQCKGRLLEEMLSVLECDDVEVSEKGHLACQTIFNIIDHITSSVRLRKMMIANVRGSSRQRITEAEKITIGLVQSFLLKIPQETMAMASYRCNSHARAVKHFELHMRNAKKKLKNTADRERSEEELQALYGVLQKLYAHMDEPDGMRGIAAMVKSPTIEQQIIENEVVGKWIEAQTDYELQLHNNPNDLKSHIGLVNCLKTLGHLETLINHVNGALSFHPDWEKELSRFGIEAACRLSKWESLDHFLDKPHDSSFEANLGSVVKSLRIVDREKFDSVITDMRGTIAGSVAVAAKESYRRAHDHILNLHILEEVESIFEIVEKQAGKENDLSENLNGLLGCWESRLNITLPSFKTREPLLNLRRTLLGVLSDRVESEDINARIRTETGRIWLQTAKEARKAGYQQTAYNAVLHSSNFKLYGEHIERAKLLRENGETQKAISVLRTMVNSGFKEFESNLNDAELESTVAKNWKLDTRSHMYVKAKTHLLLGRWMEETNVRNLNVIRANYKSVIEEQRDWEKGYYFLGRYYNKLIESENSVNKDSMIPTKIQVSYMAQVCKYYSRALKHGTRYIYDTLPRMLTIWLDLGDVVSSISSDTLVGITRESELVSSGSDVNEVKAQFKIITKIMDNLWKEIPAYQLLTAFSQIVSRIGHQNQQVFEGLENMISAVLLAYPEQALWHLMSVYKSTNKLRSSRCSSILHKVKSKTPLGRPFSMSQIINEALKLTDLLLDLCNRRVTTSQTTMHMNTDFQALNSFRNLNMIIPLQSSMSFSLPQTSTTLTTHRPFNLNELPRIRGFKNEVEIMPSLQRPRKITILGHDGKEYIFLCKPKDDLRKDARLMEFNSLVNKLLKKDPESRKRNLHIRTYGVIPLNEECGLIEWVNNTAGFRHILLKYYKGRNIYTSPQEVKSMIDKNKHRLPELFVEELVPNHPPLFHEWFLETFPRPRDWFESRLRYSSTLAVMSIVGNVVGLGDRHGENILFDETNGDTVHVDFNCLFEKGAAFEIPERVPFRLTHNMVDAFGVTGVEGVFRKSCEITAKILRNNRESLMSVLEAFIHDPLCEWSKKKDKPNPPEVRRELAMKALQVIDRKLQGCVASIGTQPLSVEEQVDHLISEATDVKNLAEMYVGWAAFM